MDFRAADAFATASARRTTARAQRGMGTTGRDAIVHTITLKATAASGGRVFPVHDSRAGGLPPEFPLGPSGDGHAVFYRVTGVPLGVPLTEVLRLFGGTEFRHPWEGPFDRLGPGAPITPA